MTQFSIKEALRFSFSTYTKHIVLLLCAGVVVATTYEASKQVPRILSEKLGVHQDINLDIAVSPQDNKIDQSALVLKKVQEITTKISTHIQTAPKHLLLLVFLTWFVLWVAYFATVLGFMKLCLDLRDTGKGSLLTFISLSLHQIRHFIGAFMYVVCSIIGVSVLIISFAVISKHFFGDVITGVLSLLLLFGLFSILFVWIVSSSFFGFCIADNPAMNSRQSLNMSRNLTYGQHWHVIGAFIAASFFRMISLMIINKFFGFSFSGPTINMMMDNSKDFAQFLSMIVTFPFLMLYFAFIYRSLHQK